MTLSVCDKSCRGCIYCSVLSGGEETCDYILVTHNRRGCPAGKGCERRISGTKALTIDQQIYRGRVSKNLAKLAEAGELPPAEMEKYLAEQQAEKARKRQYDKERNAAKLEAMTPEELEAYRERVRQYSRDYYASLDPEKKAARNAKSAALKRQRRLEKKQQKEMNAS